MDLRRLRSIANQLDLALGQLNASTFGQIVPRCEIELLGIPQLSPNTIRIRRAALRRVSPRYDGHPLDGSWREVALELYAELPKPTASLTVNTVYWALRFAERVGLRSPGDAQISDLAKIVASPRTKWLSCSELAQLDDALDAFAARRTFGAGVDALRACMLLPFRVSAICSLTWANVGGDCSTISLTDKGKTRTWPVGSVVQALLQRRRRDGARSPYVFPGRLVLSPVSRVTVFRILKRACDAAGLDKRGVCVHSMRNSLATNLIEQGESLDTVQAAFAHSDPKTTRRYLCIVPSRATHAVADYGAAIIAAKESRR